MGLCIIGAHEVPTPNILNIPKPFYFDALNPKHTWSWLYLFWLRSKLLYGGWIETTKQIYKLCPCFFCVFCTKTPSLIKI